MNPRSHKTVRAALLACLASLLLIIASKTAICQQTAVVPAPVPQSSSTGQVVLTVTVTNKQGEYVKGLDKSHFTVFDNKAEQEITYFKEQDEPLSIGIIFNASGTMSEPGRRDLMKTFYDEKFSRFIQQSNESNEYFLIGFNERPQLLLDWTRDPKTINAALDKLKPVKLEGKSALYDACYLGIEKVILGTHRKRALILISDGRDNFSHYKFIDLRRLLRESDVLFYSIAIINPADISHIDGRPPDQPILGELAFISGSLAIFPEKPLHLRNTFDLVAKELRHQYSIGFKLATPTKKEEWHRIKVKLNIPPGAAARELQNLTVRSREGYYPNVGLR